MFRNFFKVTALPPYVDFAVLILRVGTAALMIPHGWGKFQRMMDGEWSFADPLGVGEVPSLFLTIFAELVCSILVVIGLLTRPALAFLIITMLVVVFRIHWKDGLEEMEHGLLFLIPFISLFIWGPGRYSLDYSIFGKKKR